MPVILPFRRLRHENYKFEARLGYIATPCIKTTATTRKNAHSVSESETTENVLSGSLFYFLLFKEINTFLIQGNIVVLTLQCALSYQTFI
jgi:hypothetical protein